MLSLNKLLAFFLCLFCLAALLPALGRKDGKTTPAEEENRAAWQEERQAPQEEERGWIQISGRVRLVGNAPFSELVITSEEGQWYVPREEEYILMDLQQQTVTVEGLETVMELTFANGVPAGERHTLMNIIIISVQESFP